MKEKCESDFSILAYIAEQQAPSLILLEFTIARLSVEGNKRRRLPDDVRLWSAYCHIGGCYLLCYSIIEHTADVSKVLLLSFDGRHWYAHRRKVHLDCFIVA